MVKAAYSSDLVTVYHGKAEDILPTLARGSVDLIATDPPYGVGWRSNRGQNFDFLDGDDGTLDVAGILGLAMVALRPRRHVYVFGPADLSSIPALAAPTQLVWDKGIVGMGDLSSPWAPQHELITFASHVPSPANRKQGDGRLTARLRQGSVVRVTRPNSRGVNRHPTEKPVALMRQLIESSTVLGETVLDPFAGSGSTLVAAVLSGRSAVGIELDEGHVAAMVERVKSAEKLVRAMATA